MLELGILQTQLTNSHWERFQTLASEWISPKIKIDSGQEADKAAYNFTASIALAYRLSTRKITLSTLNKNLPGLESWLKHKQRLRILWQVAWDLACETTVNWVTKTIGWMTCRKTIEQWETKAGNCGILQNHLWKWVDKKLKSPLWLIRNNISSERESLCDCRLFRKPIHISWPVWQMETRVQALLTSVDGTPMGKVRLCDIT
jgi:hypothetical protein